MTSIKEFQTASGLSVPWMGCLNWSLTPEDREILRRDFPEQRLRSGSVPLQ